MTILLGSLLSCCSGEEGLRAPQVAQLAIVGVGTASAGVARATGGRTVPAPSTTAPRKTLRRERCMTAPMWWVLCVRGLPPRKELRGYFLTTQIQELKDFSTVPNDPMNGRRMYSPIGLG